MVVGLGCNGVGLGSRRHARGDEAPIDGHRAGCGKKEGNMATWLRTEETPFEEGPLIRGATRGARATVDHTVLLRSIRVIDNKKLFGSADVIVYAVVLDGYPDMESGKPFWAQQFAFPDVRDGATLDAIDPDLGIALYRGKPADFLNLYLMVVRDKQATRDLAKVLSENLVAEGLGTIAGAAISTYAGLPPGITAPMVRDLAKKAVETTLDFFAKQKNPVIGVYYASLLPGHGYGSGLHPTGFPADRLSCGDALEIAYEVRKDEP